MRISTFVLGLALSANAFSNTLEQANTLFSKRGEKAQYAKEAADAYKALATQATDSKTQALRKVDQAKALYFFGGKVSSKEQKLSVYKEAYTSAKSAISLLSSSTGVPASDVTPAELAFAHYQYAINLARWGKTNGITSSISKLPELMRNLETVIKLDETVANYGAYRTIGKTKYAVPAAIARLVGLGNFTTDDALDALFTAYDNTVMYVDELGVETSKNSTTTLYILDVLAELEERGDFCDIFRSVKLISEKGDAFIAKLFPTKTPEAKEDFKFIMDCAASKDKCEAGDIAAGKDFTELAKSCR